MRGVRSGSSTTRLNGPPQLRVGGPKAVRRSKPVKSVGRNDHLHYDPKTGRRLPKDAR